MGKNQEKVQEILDGWGNYLMGSDPTTEEEAERRATICAGCEHLRKGLHAALLPDYKLKQIKGRYCGVCKCPSSTMVRSMNHHCEKGKW